MHFRFVSALVALALTGLGVASCTQDFGQFDPKPGQGDCMAGEKSCNDVCVPPDDPQYGCGSSCDPCVLENASTKCATGTCAIDTCNTGFENCDGNGANGCEIATASDAKNCGACATQCSAPNAAGLCQGGMCGVGPCNTGFDNCDTLPINGCEAILSTDPNNCGACGTMCNAFQVCANGICKNNPCGPGTADCNSDGTDGCETPIDTALNCGFCKNACNPMNGNPACMNGMCAIESCMAGFADCDTMPGNGCEVDVNQISNCGTCGNACPSGPNSTATCTGGMCGLNCSVGFADCNNNPADGCEVNTQTSAANCSACGHVCNGTNSVSTACTAGVCAPTCDTGWGDCVKPVAPMPDDGCETPTIDDVFNCGACGRTCSGTRTASRECTGSTCTSTCDLGYANCATPSTGTDEGCEVTAMTSGLNCGGCANDCSDNLVCVGGTLAQKHCGCANNGACGGGGVGTCSATGVCSCNGTTCGMGENCVANACSCNGLASCGAGMLCCQNPAGCVDPYTDADNCGACGRACPSGFVCTGTAPAAPQCRCDADADCNGGSAGVCTMTGACMCGAMQCAIGERCLSNGTCG